MCGLLPSAKREFPCHSRQKRWILTNFDNQYQSLSLRATCFGATQTQDTRELADAHFRPFWRSPHGHEQGQDALSVGHLSGVGTGCWARSSDISIKVAGDADQAVVDDWTGRGAGGNSAFIGSVPVVVVSNVLNTLTAELSDDIVVVVEVERKPFTVIAAHQYLTATHTVGLDLSLVDHRKDLLLRHLADPPTEWIVHKPPACTSVIINEV